MERGEVWDVDFPPPPGKPTRELAGPHPALVVSTKDNSANPMVMVVPFTSKSNALRFPYTLMVTPSAENGLTVQSVLLVLQLRAVGRARLKSKMGSLEAAFLREADRLIREMLGFQG
ncbi:MAG: type II toxin-antitoxin system PemK/MazF family toxin [Anaerolineales bacterium]|nr:type II toxin-antitoxin system PemK/MazF family toxin [Anaerolineales bacterium]